MPRHCDLLVNAAQEPILTSSLLLEHAYLLESCMRGKAGLEGLQLLMQARDFPTGLVQLGLSMARFLPCLLQRSDCTTASRTAHR